MAFRPWWRKPPDHPGPCRCAAPRRPCHQTSGAPAAPVAWQPGKRCCRFPCPGRIQLGVAAAAPSTFGSANLAPPALAHEATARATSSLVRSVAPPLAGMPRMPSTACLTRCQSLARCGQPRRQRRQTWRTSQAGGVTGRADGLVHGFARAAARCATFVGDRHAHRLQARSNGFWT